LVSYLQPGLCLISCLMDFNFIVNIFCLDGEGGQLSWLRRMKIAIGIAQGLRYLHTELQPPFAISELNSNSVYVTEDFTPKVCPAQELVHASSFVSHLLLLVISCLNSLQLGQTVICFYYVSPCSWLILNAGK